MIPNVENEKNCSMGISRVIQISEANQEAPVRNLKIFLLPTWMFMLTQPFPFCSGHVVESLEWCRGAINREMTRPQKKSRLGLGGCKFLNRKEEKIKNECRFESVYQQPLATYT